MPRFNQILYVLLATVGVLGAPAHAQAEAYRTLRLSLRGLVVASPPAVNPEAASPAPSTPEEPAAPPPPRVTNGLSLDGLAGYYPLQSSLQSSVGVALTAAGGIGFSTDAAPFLGSPGHLQLNANAGLYNASSGVVAGAGDVSVGAWVRTTGTSEQTVVQQRSDGDASTIDGQFRLFLLSGKLCYLDGSNLAFGATVCHSSVVNDGTWHHVGFRRPATGGVRLFVNGTGQNFSYPLRSYKLRPGLSIGFDQRAWKGGYPLLPLSGGIADVWLYQRGVTDSEFAQAFSSAAPLQ